MIGQCLCKILQALSEEGMRTLSTLADKQTHLGVKMESLIIHLLVGAHALRRQRIK